MWPQQIFAWELQLYLMKTCDPANFVLLFLYDMFDFILQQLAKLIFISCCLLDMVPY
jgi:hypothetical protein